MKIKLFGINMRAGKPRPYECFWLQVYGAICKAFVSCHDLKFRFEISRPEFSNHNANTSFSKPSLFCLNRGLCGFIGLRGLHQSTPKVALADECHLKFQCQ